MSADKEAVDLLAELDAEFGKKPKPARKQHAIGAGSKDRSDGKQRLLSAKEQIEMFQFKDISDWRAYREQLEANEIAQQLAVDPLWLPDARLTYIVEQTCACCNRKVEYVAGDYVRFRSPRQRAVIIRRAEVCTDLAHFGKMQLDGSIEPLPDLVDTIRQSVPRCAVCIRDERQVEEMWWKATINGKATADLPLEINIEE
jgi:hypothetical protein